MKDKVSCGLGVLMTHPFVMTLRAGIMMFFAISIIVTTVYAEDGYVQKPDYYKYMSGKITGETNLSLLLRLEDREITNLTAKAVSVIRVQDKKEEFGKESMLNAGLTRLNIAVANEFVVLSPVGVGTFAEIPNTIGFDLLRRSFTQSLREIGTNTPIFSYMGSLSEGLTEVTRNSFANIDEQEMQPLQVAPLPSETIWKKSLREKTGFTYGVRPFSQSPYVFTGFKFRPDGEHEVVTSIRYHVEDLSVHRVVVSASLEIGGGWCVDNGFEFRTKMNSRSNVNRGERCVGIVRLTRFIENGPLMKNGMFFTGINVNDQDLFGNLGLQFKW